MKSLKNITIAFLLIFVGAGCSVLDKNKQAKNKTKTSTQNSTSTQNKKSNLKKYENKKLSISFSYPKELGKIKANISETKDHISLALPKVSDNAIFLAADNGQTSTARGGYWGDWAENIDSKKFITDLCQLKSSYTKDFIDCKIKTNSSGITFSKVNKTIMEMGPRSEAVNYYIFNPHSEYRDIILSTDQLKEAGVKNPEEKLDTIVRSLTFVNQDIKKDVSDDDKEKISLPTSEKLVSPNVSKKFFFASNKSKISGKKVTSRNKYSDLYFAFNGDTEFMISKKGEGYQDSEFITNLFPKVEFSDGRIKDITKYLKNFSKSQGAAKVLRWYNNNSLLLGSSYGDAGSTWMNIATIDVTDGDTEKILSCYSDALPSKDSAISYCVHDDILYLQDCDIVSDQQGAKTNCNKAGTYRIDRSNVNFEGLRYSSKLRDWSKKIQNNAKKLDEVDTNDYLTFFDEADKFNIENAGDQFKIKSIKEGEDKLILNLSNGNLTKTNDK